MKETKTTKRNSTKKKRPTRPPKSRPYWDLWSAVPCDDEYGEDGAEARQAVANADAYADVNADFAAAAAAACDLGCFGRSVEAALAAAVCPNVETSWAFGEAAAKGGELARHFAGRLLDSGSYWRVEWRMRPNWRSAD